MAAELNARIGRILPAPALIAATAPGSRIADVWMRAPAAAYAAALLVALWPHWLYVARRMVDGSDEPWGALALATVIVLIGIEASRLATPPRAALLLTALLTVTAAVAQLLLPDLLAAAVAMLAVGCFVVYALPHRPATALVALLLLSLPLVASLQFYLGFPLRVLAAHAASALLNLIGVDAHATGAAITAGDAVVLIDAPCAGIGMLWSGSYLAALLSYLQRCNALQTLGHAAAAALLVLAANIVRNAVLFFPESGRVDWPAWSHDTVGWLAFAAAIVPLVLLIVRRPA